MLYLHRFMYSLSVGWIRVRLVNCFMRDMTRLKKKPSAKIFAVVICLIKLNVFKRSFTFSCPFQLSLLFPEIRF